MMLREYECTVITKADLPEAERAKVLGRYENLFTSSDGEILKREEWGARKLSYPINEQFRGHYVHYDFVTKSENVNEAERLMRIDDNVLRYLSIKIGENVDVTARKAALVKATLDAQAMLEAEREY